MMTLQTNLVPMELLESHVEACDVRFCPICQVAWEREYEADNAARLEAERDQDAERDEFEQAEIRRDLGLDDNEASDFCGDDLRMGDLPR